MVETTEFTKREHYSVAKVNGKVVTVKENKLYGVPEGDLSFEEEKAVLNYVKCLEG